VTELISLFPFFLLFASYSGIASRFFTISKEVVTYTTDTAADIIDAEPTIEN